MLSMSEATEGCHCETSMPETEGSCVGSVSEHAAVEGPLDDDEDREELEEGTDEEDDELESEDEEEEERGDELEDEPVDGL